LGRDFRFDADQFRRSEDRCLEQLTEASLQSMAAAAAPWTDRLADAIAKRAFRAVGCTTTFEQTAASVALLNRIKQRRPEVVTLLGGANCEGEMAAGIQSLEGRIDVVFSGESEQTFPAFLQRLCAGERLEEPVVVGSPCLDLDALPAPRFDEFYQQLKVFLPEGEPSPPGSPERALWLPYETSRGCWWGAKRHCTFCGLNAQTMAHREKTPTRVMADLDRLLRSHPTRQVCMVDNIMPHSYFKTLLPRLSEELPGLHIFYEQKSNLSLANVVALKKAGIHVIQPGIEALSSALLRRMKKGVSAAQNLALLRYARGCDLALNWNLLYGFPGDSSHEYRETRALLPLLSHLNPPGGLYRLSIDRFSPYFDDSEEYGLTNVEPLEGYAAVLPEKAKVDQIAYHFTADYSSGILEDQELLRQIDVDVGRWRARWELVDQAPPSLAVEQLEDDLYLLLDTRGLEGSQMIRFLDQEQASLVLLGAPLDGMADCSWAFEGKLLVEVDSRYVPLATAEPELLARFEAARPIRSAANLALPVENVRNQPAAGR
jgi:ribosomal peptide maturation radical SAM protein 1